MLYLYQKTKTPTPKIRGVYQGVSILHTEHGKRNLAQCNGHLVECVFILLDLYRKEWILLLVTVYNIIFNPNSNKIYNI